MENTAEVEPFTKSSDKQPSCSSIEEETCGFGSYSSNRRNWRCLSLQYFASINWALLFFCIATLLHESLIGGLYGVSISTIQKRFELRSTESGVIAICYDVAMCAGLLFIPYYGAKGSKPLWIGWGTALMGIGSITVAMPHIMAPSYSPMKELETTNVCGNVTTSSLQCERHIIRNYRYMFMFGIALAGLGGTALTTLAFTYIDENVHTRDSALYSGIYLAVGSIGPGLGYFIGGPLLWIYTNLRQKTTLEQTDPLWVGAWWVGFIIVGSLLIFVSGPIGLLPKKLSTRPRTTEVRNSRTKSQSEVEIISKLIRNPTYILITFGSAVNFAFLYGANTFAAKYLEAMFGVQPGEAAVLFGVSTIIGAAFAMALSGAIITKFNLKQIGMIRFMVVCALFSALCSFGFLLKCPEEGAHTFEHGEEDYMNTVISSCQSDCNCTTEIYTPVCGADHVTYFSPCFAGCTKKINNTLYEDCKCLQTEPRNAVAGKCKPMHNCKNLFPFMVSIFFCFFTSILTVPPSIQVTMRCVDFDSRSVALGIQRVLAILFGIVPGRVLTGIVIDLTCTVWGTHCGEKGSCRSYRRKGLSMALLTLALIETGACFVFYLIACLTYKPQATDEVLRKEVGPGNNEEILLQTAAV